MMDLSHPKCETLKLPWDISYSPAFIREKNSAELYNSNDYDLFMHWCIYINICYVPRMWM